LKHPEIKQFQQNPFLVVFALENLLEILVLKDSESLRKINM
jgi:hypothetical protein